MAIYRVMISGKGLQLPEENGSFLNVGFVKNVYLSCNSKEAARSSALSIVEQELADQEKQGKVTMKKLELVIDEIESTYMFWKLVNKEGFIFFPDEDQDS